MKKIFKRVTLATMLLATSAAPMLSSAANNSGDTFNHAGLKFMQRETQAFLQNLQEGDSLCDDMSAVANLRVRWSHNRGEPVGYDTALHAAQQTCDEIKDVLYAYQNTDTLTVAFASAGLKNGYGYAVVDLDAFVEYQLDIFNQCTEEANATQGFIAKAQARAACRQTVRSSADPSYLLASKMELIEDVSHQDVGALLGVSHVRLPNIGEGDYYSFGVMGGGFSCLSGTNCYLAAGGVYINAYITVEALLDFYQAYGLPLVAINIPVETPGNTDVIIAPTPEELPDRLSNWFNRR